jgi:TrmH family RNA methyltransferase
VAAALRLKKRSMREKDRRFLVEGAQAVLEALASGASVHEVFRTSGMTPRLEPAVRAAERAGLPVREVSDDVMALLTSTVTPQGVVAVAGVLDVSLDEIPGDASMVPVLVEVRDPGNAGTIVRSADASGADAVVFTESSVDVYNPKAVRATAGSLFHVPVVRAVRVDDAVAHLRRRGFQIVAASADADRSVYQTDLRTPTAVLFGTEARGLPDGVPEAADLTVRIPIRRAESLNLAAAATVFLFEAARQRGGAAALADVVAGAAHDIRSPLAAMKGFADILRKRGARLTDEQRVEMLQGIAQTADRMTGIVAQLVDAARLESRRLTLSRERLDLLEAARTARDAAVISARSDIQVTGSGPVQVLADPARLATILRALLEGAEWWGETGPVRVEVGTVTRPTVRVSRAKTALDAEGASGLFQPRAPGTGQGGKFGLFVARGLAEAHGGRLDVAVDGGVTFVLELPPVDGG